MPDRGDILGAASLREEDAQRIARQLYALKARAYRDTLAELAARHGEPRKRIILSAEIREALEAEAIDSARRTVYTYNRMLASFAARREGMDPDQFARELQAYARARGKSRLRVAASFAPLNPRLDAEIAFYRENGVEPDFDFIGPPPKCALCVKLKKGGPWSVEDVLRIGLPHLGCTHHWRARTRAVEQLREGGLRPGQISAGRGTIAGVVGSGALLSRVGGHDPAFDVIEALNG